MGLIYGLVLDALFRLLIKYNHALLELCSQWLLGAVVSCLQVYHFASMLVAAWIVELVVVEWIYVFDVHLSLAFLISNVVDIRMRSGSSNFIPSDLVSLRTAVF
jgi:hypothetical protein